MSHFSNRSKAIHFSKGIVRFNWKVAKTSLVVGMGPFLMNTAACIVTLFINQQLRHYSGDLGIGAYGICNRFIFMFIMICMGLNQGMQPIAGYNYGARQYARVREVFWKTARLATYVTTLCFVIGVFFPKAAMSIFTHDEELLELSASALRVLTLVFPIVGFQMIGTNFFQSLGLVKKSIFLSLSRQLIFLLPSLYILPLFIGTKGVWFSFTVSDILSALLTAILIHKAFKKFNTLKDGENATILGGQI
jgi:Na+-driven multidrug efflux pump